MKYFTIIYSICMTLVLVSSQFFGPHFDTFGSYNSFGLRSLSPDFGPSAFSGSLRDPRQNRGPVVFPQSPPSGAPEESSGVIVGASGYGFVPPQNQYRSKK